MYQIVIQLNVDKRLVPAKTKLRAWATQALEGKVDAAEVTLRIVDPSEMTGLNSTYRHKQGPTNVLSFPFSVPDGVTMRIPPLGDIVICADVVNREAETQHKPREAHWAHMVVHGIYHLLGYDHELEADAETMEALEINTLKKLGFANPYEQDSGDVR